MARAGKSGGKRTSFGKRTKAEESFRDRRREKPQSRSGSEERSAGNKRFSSPSRFSSSRGEGRAAFPPKSDSDKRFKKKAGEGYRREGSSSSPRENRFSRPAKFSRGKGEGRSGEGKTPFRKSGPGPFRGNSGDKKFSKPFDRSKEGGDRFSKFKKEKEKPFDTGSDRNSGFERPTPRKGRSERVGDFKKPYVSREKKTFSKPRVDQPLKAASTETPDVTGGGLIRLNKFMANSGVGSRREADEYIKMGLVTVNGETITEMGHKVKATDDVRYEGRKLKAEPLVYILLNKPKGFITTTDDPEERRTVMELVASACKERIYPVGRLDRNTTGLLLLTNDGDLADKLTHPSYNAKKIYKVELDRPLTKNDFQKILDGVYFDEGRAQVDDLAIVSDDGKEVGIELHIGWNRIVRRIFEALGYQIAKLDRVAYAGLDKKDLGRGQWRFLKPEEVVRLKHFNN